MDCFESLGYMLNVSIYHMMGCQLSVNVIYIKYKLIRLMYTPVLWRYTYLKWLKKLIIFLRYIPLQWKKNMAAAIIVLKSCVDSECFQFYSPIFLYVNTSARKFCGITNLIHQNIFIWCGAAIKNKHLRLVICYLSTSILLTCTS